MGKGVDVMRDYEMALKLNSHYGLAYFNTGNVYFHHRQFQQVTLYNSICSNYIYIVFCTKLILTHVLSFHYTMTLAIVCMDSHCNTCVVLS